MDDQFDSKTETFWKWLNHVGVQVSSKAELTNLRAHGRGRALGMWLLFTMLSKTTAVIACNMAKSHGPFIILSFFLRILANDFLSRQG